MKPVVREEEIVMAVAAARTAWILTDVDRKYNELRWIVGSEPPDSGWWFRRTLNANQSPFIAGGTFWHGNC